MSWGCGGNRYRPEKKFPIQRKTADGRFYIENLPDDFEIAGIEAELERMVQRISSETK